MHPDFLAWFVHDSLFQYSADVNNVTQQSILHRTCTVYSFHVNMWIYTQCFSYSCWQLGPDGGYQSLCAVMSQMMASIGANTSLSNWRALVGSYIRKSLNVHMYSKEPGSYIYIQSHQRVECVKRRPFEAFFRSVRAAPSCVYLTTNWSPNTAHRQPLARPGATTQ